MKPCVALVGPGLAERALVTVICLLVAAREPDVSQG